MIDWQRKSNVELNELIKTTNLKNLNDRHDVESICEILASWLNEKKIRDVELNLLLKISNLNFCWIFKLDVLIATCWCCEISVIWLIEKQNRSVESSELLKTTDLNDLNRLIENLIELYSLAFVSDVSTRIFLLIKSMSTTTKYLDFNESIETRILILDLINDVKFVSNVICEIFAFWLIEKQIRNVELKQLIKILNLIDLIDVKFD